MYSHCFLYLFPFFYLGHLSVQLFDAFVSCWHITFLFYFFRWYLYFCVTNKIWFDFNLIWYSHILCSWRSMFSYNNLKVILNFHILRSTVTSVLTHLRRDENIYELRWMQTKFSKHLPVKKIENRPTAAKIAIKN